MVIRIYVKGDGTHFVKSFVVRRGVTNYGFFSYYEYSAFSITDDFKDKRYLTLLLYSVIMSSR